jgi:cytochrome c-type biogenesis protein CcmE
MSLRARHRRLLWLAALLLAVGGTVYAVLRAFNDNMVFFYSPSDVQAGKPPAGRAWRLGGMVETGSILRTPGSLEMRFRVTDGSHTLAVRYSGVTPDLFKEGKGVVAQGRLVGEVFEATEILAKHDENYMPPKLNQK